ncbi:MAG: glutamate dehydrogenase, partial [Actinomycetota bacterium]|nr:glutamate dehydrogenase [Actinomycetota bacterium]
IYNDGGLDLAALDLHRRESLSVQDFTEGDKVTNEELLELDCEVLIPAAIHGVINTDNAADIKAPIIVEAANGPTTPAADAMLNDAGKTIVPDILANAGGVTVSYFEWVQNIQHFSWDSDQVNYELKKRMTRAIDEVFVRVTSEGLSLRQAAFDISVKRVARAAELRGYV